MKLVIDGRWVRTEYHDGISRYTAGLVEGFLAAGREVTVLIHDDAQRRMLPGGVAYLKVNQPISVRELFLARRLNEFGADYIGTIRATGYSIDDHEVEAETPARE